MRLERLDRGDRDTTAGWARGAIARAGLAVRQQLDARDRSARRYLAQAAALALEACATTWEAFGAAGGARRLHLVRGLEQDLAQQERILRAAEAGYRVDRQAVAACARAARAAVERLREGGQDPAGALFALEHNVLALATVAIRAIENIDASERASGPPRGSAPLTPDALIPRFAELHAHARRLLDGHHCDDLARWLSECLVIAVRASAHGSAEETAGDPRSGPTLRRAEPRRAWVRLGARELLIARELAAPGGGPDPGRTAVSAARILAGTGLAARPDALEPRLAAERHLLALSPLVPICARAARKAPAAARHGQLILADRLAHVLAVLWLIDHSRPRRH